MEGIDCCVRSPHPSTTNLFRSFPLNEEISVKKWLLYMQLVPYKSRLTGINIRHCYTRQFFLQLAMQCYREHWKTGCSGCQTPATLFARKKDNPFNVVQMTAGARGKIEKVKAKDNLDDTVVWRREDVEDFLTFSAVVTHTISSATCLANGSF